MTIRVLLVDDQELFREGLETLLSVHKDIEVVGQACNGREAIEVATRVRPDLVLMDITMPEKSGVRFYRDIKENDEYKATPVIMVTREGRQTGQLL